MQRSLPSKGTLSPSSSTIEISISVYTIPVFLSVTRLLISTNCSSWYRRIVSPKVVPPTPVNPIIFFASGPITAPANRMDFSFSVPLFTVIRIKVAPCSLPVIRTISIFSLLLVTGCPFVIFVKVK